MARRVALPAAVLCVLALFPLSHLGTQTWEIASAPPPAAPPIASRPPVETAPLSLAAVEAAAFVPVRVQVNARPWARIRIDGVDVGPTPLSRPLAPGVYSFDAEFADGRRVQRRVDVGPGQRFVSLQ